MEREEKKKRREGRGERGGNSPDLIADSLGAGDPLVPVLLGIHSSEGVDLGIHMRRARARVSRYYCRSLRSRRPSADVHDL